MADEIQRRTAKTLTHIFVGTVCVVLSVTSYLCFYRWFIVQSGWDNLNALQKRYALSNTL